MTFPQSEPSVGYPALTPQELETLLRARLGAILDLVKLEYGGEVIEPNGFSLYRTEGGTQCCD